MNKYEISVKVEGYVKVQVNAASMDEAEFAAMDRVNEMDFGPLHEIDYEINECGNEDLGPAEDLDSIPIVWDMNVDGYVRRNNGGDVQLGSFFMGRYCVELFATNPDYPQHSERQEREPVDVYVFDVPGYSTWDEGDGTEYSFADNITFDVPYEYEPIDAFKAECEARFRAAVLKAAPNSAAPDPIVLAKEPLAPWAPPSYQYYEIELWLDGKVISMYNISIIIKAVREPTLEEADDFLEEDRHLPSGKELHAVKITPLQRWEAMADFDLSNEASWPIFGVQRKYKVEFCYEDDFPVTVLETDDLAEALDCADCFTTPEGWEEEVGENNGEYSVLMRVEDTTINCCVYWTNNDGDRSSDAKDDYPGANLIDARL